MSPPKGSPQSSEILDARKMVKSVVDPSAPHLGHKLRMKTEIRKLEIRELERKRRDLEN